METLEEIADRSELMKLVKRMRYFGDGLFATGTGLALSTGVAGGPLPFIIASSYMAAGGAALSYVSNYTERFYTRRAKQS